MSWTYKELELKRTIYLLKKKLEWEKHNRAGRSIFNWNMHIEAIQEAIRLLERTKYKMDLEKDKAESSSSRR